MMMRLLEQNERVTENAEVNVFCLWKLRNADDLACGEFEKVNQVKPLVEPPVSMLQCYEVPCGWRSRCLEEASYCASLPLFVSVPQDTAMCRVDQNSSLTCDVTNGEGSALERRGKMLIDALIDNSHIAQIGWCFLDHLPACLFGDPCVEAQRT